MIYSTKNRRYKLSQTTSNKDQTTDSDIVIAGHPSLCCDLGLISCKYDILLNYCEYKLCNFKPQAVSSGQTLAQIGVHGFLSHKVTV